MNGGHYRWYLDSKKWNFSWICRSGRPFPRDMEILKQRNSILELRLEGHHKDQEIYKLKAEGPRYWSPSMCHSFTMWSSSLIADRLPDDPKLVQSAWRPLRNQNATPDIRPSYLNKIATPCWQAPADQPNVQKNEIYQFMMTRPYFWQKVSDRDSSSSDLKKLCDPVHLESVTNRGVKFPDLLLDLIGNISSKTFSPWTCSKRLSINTRSYLYF